MRTISVSQPARGIAGGLLLSLVVVLLTGTASAGISIPLQGSSLAPSGRDYTPLSIKSGGQYRQEPTGDTAVLAGKYVDRTATIPRIDATALGIGPLTGAPPDGMIPDSGAIGKGGAFVSLAPDMIPANIPYDIGIVATSFQPNESLAIKINGIPGSTGTADANGRLATVLTVQGNGSLGYFTFDALGLSSGREGAGVVLLSPTLGAFPPGLAVAPHAINRTGNFITLVGANFPSNAAITITADGTVIATTTSDASGAFGGEIPLTSGVPTSRVVSAYASSGMRVGQSVELRNDAGPPPLGDQNMVWAMVDRALLGTAPHIFGIVGEGFLPGEPVHIVACPQFLIGTAAGDGSVGFLLPTGAGSGFNDCLLTGQSSGRIAHVSIGGASNGLNLPGMIAAPASLLNTGGGTGQALLTRLIPNQSGTLYLDGTSLGSVSSGATGSVSVPFPKPTSGFLHTLSWIGTGGQAVAAPILYWPAAGTSTPTPTITRTSTPTYTPTRTPTGTNTPTITPTRPPCGYRILVAHADTVPPVTLRNALLADNRVNSVDLFNAGAGTPTLAQLQQYQIVVTYSNLGYLDPHALGNVLADYQDGGGVVVAGFGSFLEATSIGGRWRTGGYSPYDFGFNIVSNAVTLGSHNPAHPLLQGVTTLNAGARAANSVSAGATQVAAYSDTSPAVAFKSTSGHTALGITVYLGEAGNGGSGDYAKLIVNAGSWLWPGGSCSTPTPVPTSTLTPTTTHTHTHTHTPTHTSTRTSTPSNTPTHTRTNTPLPTQTPGGPSATPIPTNTNTPTHTNTPSNTPSNTRTSTPSNTPSNTRTNTPLPTHTPGGPSATPIPTNTNASTGTPTNTSVVSTPTSQSGGTATSTTPALATATPASCALEFADVPPDHTFYANIRCLACRGIISGYACGGPGEPCNQSNDPYFRPANLVTRGQIAKIVSNAAGFIEPHSEQSFEDVPPASTFHEFVERLASRGVMGGYVCGGAGEPCVPPGNLPYFRPNVTATRGQLAKIVANAAGLGGPVSGQMFEDAPPTHTFYEFIERLIALGVMGGYACGEPGEPCVPPDNRPYFRPADSVTRGQTTKIVSNTFYPGCQTPRR